MNHPRPTTAAAVAAVAALVLTACGGGDDPVPADLEPAPTVSFVTPDFDGPTATLSPEIPDAFDGSIGRMDVIGQSLPALTPDVGAADPAVGTPAPVIIGENFDGIPTRVDAASDGPTMVIFLAHWCPHCNDEIPVLNSMRDAGAFPAELNIVAVSTSPSPDSPNYPPSEWLVEKNWTYPVVVDGVDVDSAVFLAADAFGVSAFPFTTLIDGDGNVAARWSGGRSSGDISTLIETSLGL